MHLPPTQARPRALKKAYRITEIPFSIHTLTHTLTHTHTHTHTHTLLPGALNKLEVGKFRAA